MGQDKLVHVVLGEHDVTKDCDCEGNKCNGPTEYVNLNSYFEVIYLCTKYFQRTPKEIIIHEEFRSEGGFENMKFWRKKRWAQANDIALIRLNKPVTQGPSIIPVCLPVNEVSLDMVKP